MHKKPAAWIVLFLQCVFLLKRSSLKQLTPLPASSGSAASVLAAIFWARWRCRCSRKKASGRQKLMPTNMTAGRNRGGGLQRSTNFLPSPSPSAAAAHLWSWPTASQSALGLHPGPGPPAHRLQGASAAEARTGLEWAPAVHNKFPRIARLFLAYFGDKRRESPTNDLQNRQNKVLRGLQGVAHWHGKVTLSIMRNTLHMGMQVTASIYSLTSPAIERREDRVMLTRRPQQLFAGGSVVLEGGGKAGGASYLQARMGDKHG